jgi:hypothetical protein
MPLLFELPTNCKERGHPERVCRHHFINYFNMLIIGPPLAKTLAAPRPTPWDPRLPKNRRFS